MQTMYQLLMSFNEDNIDSALLTVPAIANSLEDYICYLFETDKDCADGLCQAVGFYNFLSYDKENKKASCENCEYDNNGEESIITTSFIIDTDFINKLKTSDTWTVRVIANSFPIHKIM